MFRYLTHQLVAALEQHLATGRPPVVPDAGVLLWSAFVELSTARRCGFASPEPIAHSEIEAWARINRWPLAPHHVAVIRTLDDAWLAHARSTMKKAPQQSAAQPINPAAFDAVFG